MRLLFLILFPMTGQLKLHALRELLYINKNSLDMVHKKMLLFNFAVTILF